MKSKYNRVGYQVGYENTDNKGKLFFLTTA